MGFFGWVDHDPEHEQSVLRAIGAASGQDARDELGLGTIRDTFADLLFPGTSTIQQHARYFLFVQWCCELAAQKRDADAIGSELRRLETRVIKRLSDLGSGHNVIGFRSQEDLARMPSEIYWNGLQVLGIRKIPGNRWRWARVVASRRDRARLEARWEGEDVTDSYGFDRDRPCPPPGFPEVDRLDFSLTSKEAEYLRTHLSKACVDRDGVGLPYNAFPTFLAYRRKVDTDSAWNHPRASRLPEKARELLKLAAAFSRTMYGATLLYNLRVAELKIDDGEPAGTRKPYAGALLDWQKGFLRADAEIVLEQLPRLKSLGAIVHHSIDSRVTEFVQSWASLCLSERDLGRSHAAIEAVAQREICLKRAKGTSRILFSKQREKWRGQSGGQIDYRWPLVSRYLNELAVR
ncbi:MAG: DUF6361 family protein [Sphingomonas sp.]|uniref:DUF6361 family protein n=1 Tax=Sphingomonas sp. TaxID=28214 RepID=UPI003F7F041A